MKDILFITHFIQIPGELGNNRFHYITENINKANINIEIITTSFSHKKKVQRIIGENFHINNDNKNMKFTQLYEPSYKKNVSLKRFYSHYKFAKNVNKYLHFRKRPDLIYCSVPSLDVANVAAKYAKENNVKFIIDIQDLWPEAFKMIFNFPIISDVIFYPMKKKADIIYQSADEIVAVSETYLNRALEVNNKVQEGNVVFLGTEIKTFDEVFINNRYKNKPKNEIWITYVGTLGHSYDLTSVFDALEILKLKGYNNLKFIIMGDGPLKQKFERYASEKQVNTLFTGRLPYAEMVGILCECDIAVNPIKGGSAGSIINKHSDYAAAGLPVVNTQESLEYRNLVDKYQMGLNCNNNDSRDIAEKLSILIEDSELREQMGKNSRRLAEEKFDREKTYPLIFNILMA
jgi:glycosyltransferase involved in cell wall biosynthesis